MLNTIEFSHTILNNGIINKVKGKYNLNCKKKIEN